MTLHQQNRERNKQPEKRVGGVFREHNLTSSISPSRSSEKKMSSSDSASSSSVGMFHGTPSKDALRNFVAGTASGFVYVLRRGFHVCVIPGDSAESALSAYTEQR